MSVYLDVGLRADERAAVAASRRLIDLFAHTGSQINRDLSSQLGKALAAIDGSAARRELLALQQEFRRTADVEADAAARMIRDQRRLAEATAKYGEDSSRAATANAMLARSQREHVDAMVAAEAAHVRLTKASGDTANSVSRMQQLGANPIFNAVGIGSVAAMGIGLVEFGKKAGDFQASQTRLVASAGESAQNLKAVSDGILQLAGQVGYSAQDLSNNMYMVEKAGYRGADGVNVLKAAAQGAKSENADLKEVLNGLTTSMNDFGYGTDQAADVMSKMVTATSLAKTNFQDFSGSLHSAEPLIANIGKSQGLNGDQMHHLMADLYGLGAQMTQTGETAQHSFELIGHATSKLLGPTAQMRGIMGSLGLDAEDITDHLGERGVAGTLQLLQQALQAHTKDGMVDLDVHYQSAQAARAEAEAYAALPAPARAVADQIKDGTLSYKEFRKSRGGLSVEMANEIGQWNALHSRLTGYSDLIKSGIGDHISYDQALKILTGDQETLKVALQAAGENTAAVNDKIRQIDQTTREHDGTVKGFNETQETLNAKMDRAKDAFGAAAIELGSVFVPVLTDVANGAKWVGDELAKHPGIAHGVVTALEGLGGAWLTFKAINIADTILAPIARGLGSIIAGEEGATAAAGRLSGALSAIGKGGIGVAAAQMLGGAAQDATQGDDFWHSAAVVGTDAATWGAAGAALGSIIPGVGTAIGGGVGALGGAAVGIYNQIAGHAEGGPLHAPGPKGRDSALFWGADGEHVLTHHEVQRMGGHSGVYKFRSDLMNGRIVLGRAGGGALGYSGMGPDVQVAESMAGTPYSQGARDDCSGMVGRVILGAMGLPATGLPTTKNMGQWLTALGFQPGIGGPGSISVGWYDHGPNPNDGHAAMTLSNGENAEAGGSHGDFRVGSGAAGASSPQFDHHMFLPTLYGEGPGGGMPGIGYGMGAGMGGFGGGGIPPGARAGTGPGGQPGYYTANPQRVAAAEERLRHLDAEIDNAEKRKAELKATAKQSERDRLDEEIRHLKQERAQAQQRLTEAEQGTFHAMHGRRGAAGGGSPFLPVPLADQFGLSKGLPGLAEWTVGFLEDLVLGPMETAAWAALGGRPPGGALGGGFGGLGAPGGLGPGALGFPTPGLPGGGAPGAPGADDAAAAGLGGPPRADTGPAPGAGPGAGGSAASSGPSAPADLNSPLTAAQIAQLPADQQRQLLRAAFAHPSAAPSPNFYKDWYPPKPPSDADQLPPQVAQFARDHGMLDANGNLIPGALAAPPGSLTNPKSVAPPIKMQPDLSRMPGGPNGPKAPPPPPPQPPPTPWTDSTRGQRWVGDPNQPSWNKGLNLPKLGNQARQFFDWNQPGYFATGGPSGTDTIPAWLSPGEQVEQKSAVDKYGSRFMTALNQGLVDPAIVQYFDEGSNGPVEPPGQQQQQPPAQQPPQMLKAPGGPGGPQQPKPPGAPQPGQPAGPKPGDVAQTPGSQQGLSDTATPGADIHQLGSDLPAQPGIGFSGGIIGGLEGAASQAAAMGADMGTFGGAGGAVSSAMNIGFQELNRAAAYGAQAAGIGVEGILEALIPNSDATGADWSKTIPGRLLMGVTGVRPAGQQNTAGQTQQPFASNASGDQYAQPGGNTTPGAPIQILGPVHIQANDANQMHESLNQQTNMAAATVGVQRSASQAYW